MQADVISVTSASVLNIPPMTNYLLGFTKRLPKSKLPEGLPYNSSGLLKDEWLEQIKSIEDLRPEEKAVIELYEQQSGRIRGRFDSNSNVVLIAGIVDRASYIPPSTHQSHGYGMVLLRQHKDRALVVPVRLVSNKVATILEKIRPSAPVSLKGRLRRKIIPTPDGQGILSDVVMVETDMLSPADDRQILPPPPEWLVDYVRRPGVQEDAEAETEHAEAREQA
ncbi:MAG: hypothetical protein N2690_01230 [Rhodocyclaceae bacterium]|nr:hypothetical protein [Rhodocyclaceae bacterium]